MSEKSAMKKDAEHNEMLMKRDAETETYLGLFITILSIPVLVGTAWAANYRQAVVNAAAGVVLLCIGLGAIVWGRFTARRVKRL